MFVLKYYSLCLAFSSLSVILYQCSVLASEPDCSLCLAQNVRTGFECGWCSSSSQCLVDETCSGSGFVTQSGNCSSPEISSVMPSSGPPQGGTTIVIKGSNLGVSITDIINITVGTTACDMIESTYMPAQEVTCIIHSSDSETDQSTYVVVTISREFGQPQNAMAEYSFLTPVIESVMPDFGPISGGTKITVTGRNLGIGNPSQTRVQFIQTANQRRKRQADLIAGNCTVT